MTAKFLTLFAIAASTAVGFLAVFSPTSTATVLLDRTSPLTNRHNLY